MSPEGSQNRAEMSSISTFGIPEGALRALSKTDRKSIQKSMQKGGRNGSQIKNNSDNASEGHEKPQGRLRKQLWITCNHFGSTLADVFGVSGSMYATASVPQTQMEQWHLTIYIVAPAPQA